MNYYFILLFYFFTSFVFCPNFPKLSVDLIAKEFGIVELVGAPYDNELDWFSSVWHLRSDKELSVSVLVQTLKADDTFPRYRKILARHCLIKAIEQTFSFVIDNAIRILVDLDDFSFLIETFQTDSSKLLSLIPPSKYPIYISALSSSPYADIAFESFMPENKGSVAAFFIIYDAPLNNFIGYLLEKPGTLVSVIDFSFVFIVKLDERMKSRLIQRLLYVSTLYQQKYPNCSILTGPDARYCKFVSCFSVLVQADPNKPLYHLNFDIDILNYFSSYFFTIINRIFDKNSQIFKDVESIFQKSHDYESIIINNNTLTGNPDSSELDQELLQIFDIYAVLTESRKSAILMYDRFTQFLVNFYIVTDISLGFFDSVLQPGTLINFESFIVNFKADTKLLNFGSPAYIIPAYYMQVTEEIVGYYFKTMRFANISVLKQFLVDVYRLVENGKLSANSEDFVVDDLRYETMELLAHSTFAIDLVRKIGFKVREIFFLSLVLNIPNITSLKCLFSSHFVVMKIPLHLSDQQFQTLEQLTQKSIDVIILDQVFPPEATEISFIHYAAYRNAFIYWLKGPRADRIAEITDPILKKYLLLDFPYLVAVLTRVN